MRTIMKRKFMACFLVTVFALSVLLSGCGSGAGNNQNQAQQQGSDNKKKEYVVGWSMAYFDHPVYQLLMNAARELAEKQGIKLIFADGKNDPAVQASQIDNFIAQKVDAIILTPTVADPLIPAVKKVNQAKIPLVIVDRRMFTHGQDIKWDALVSWDMVKSGTLGGEQVVEALNGKGNLVVVEGTPGAGSTIDRGNAFYEVINKHPDIKVIHKVSGDFKRDKGMQVTENILQRFPKGQIDAIYYMNDEMALGGIQAIKAAGRQGEFKIISVDGEKEAMDALRKGDIDYEVIFHPDDEAVAVNVVASILRGENPYTPENLTYKGRTMEIASFEGMPWVRPTCYKVDKSNANQPEFQGW
ncbi:MAG: ribose transport system substrate-binding protein [Moorella sp. (in: firmicutes)]|nr:ribose transport system substrate-binding protein [Moorella sp. (in: firmicutes)]